MEIAINDLSFDYRLPTRTEANQALKDFIVLCQFIKQKCHNINNIKSTFIEMTTELYPGGNLSRVIQEMKDHDNKNLLLHLLVNTESISQSNPYDAFVYDGQKSVLCGYIYQTNGAVVSIKTAFQFFDSTISGTVKGEVAKIKNLSNIEHIYDYGEELGIRIYKASEKHAQPRPVLSAKGETISPMDINGEQAQELLDKAIYIRNSLYARKAGNYYEFKKTRTYEYHGFINNNLPENVITQINKYRWD